MDSFFVNIYNYLHTHKKLRWSLILLSTLIMLALSLRVEYVEDISSFFPKHDKSNDLFRSLKAKDKIAVMFTCKGEEIDGQYQLMDCVDDFATILNDDSAFNSSAKYSVGVDANSIDRITNFVYDYLPIFLTDSDYQRLEAIIEEDQIPTIMAQNYDRLTSAIGGFIADYTFRDPLGISSEVTKELQSLGEGFNYTIIDDYLFSFDGKTLVSYIEPHEGIDSKSTKALISSIEKCVKSISGDYPNIEIQYYGAPIVAEYNARQIKQDSIITLNLALILVIVLLSIAFRNKYSALLVLLPVIYGALFALSTISIVKGSISIIAVGAGSIIFGIALSYSIHLLSHTLYCKDIREVIKDMAYPLTVGSFTTIGAFAGLLFTSSTILQDLGLFASLTLIGTTIFVLIFSPHFISIKDKSNSQPNKFIAIVDRISMHLARLNRPIVLVTIIATIILAFFAGRVSFDSNMMNLNFESEEIKNAGERLSQFSTKRDNESSVFFLASDASSNQAADGYIAMCSTLDSLKSSKDVVSYSSIGKFVVSDSIRNTRIARWDDFWESHNPDKILSEIEQSANNLGFEDRAFSDFQGMISRDYRSQNYLDELNEAFPDWITRRESLYSYMAQVQIPEESKFSVYQAISQDSRLIAADRAFFSNQMATEVSNNFSLILYLSGLLVFAAMLLCYGRFEITLMAFAPMCVSWIIILGIMAIFGIEFNIVTIILSTFIFGIGDDFSIFMMDGLLSEYKDNKKVLAPHKTAIFFSAFTVIIGMGALIFAKHPAMNSLGVISLLGIVIVVIVSYTLQPTIFRLIISEPAKRGGFPFTIISLLNTIYAFGLFVLGCLVLQLLILLIIPIPIGRKRKVKLIHLFVHKFCKFFLKVMITTRQIKINEYNENFDKPAVIIANHQSFIDILVLLALNRKFVMVTNSWVWNSPFFGRIVQYLGFFNTSNGYETIVDTLQESVADGYSIVVFAEGTRSEDCTIKRLHKGAFYLAEQLKLDIVPILIYGNGLVSAKRQGLYIKRGNLVSKVLARISADSTQYGATYSERTKSITKYFRAEYLKLYEEQNRTTNPYFKDALIKNYTYKGPVLEWYMRVKLRMERWYDQYDRLLPRQGLIVDLGCGYGAMSYMLSMLSNRRTILGVDYDEQKIALANNSFSKNSKISFKCGDIRNVELPQADAFVISDTLHYINAEDQHAVIVRCIERLSKGGVLIIKDGDSSLADRHANTVESERWSTKIIGFNKTDGELCFLSRQKVEQIAVECGAEIEYIDNNSRLSNVIFVITKRE